MGSLSSTLRNRPDLKCDVLLDHLRGTRGSPNSVTMLEGALTYTRQMQLHLYHTPLLRGMAKWFLPQRFNEALGVQHTKIHLFDNNVLLTGWVGWRGGGGGRGVRGGRGRKVKGRGKGGGGKGVRGRGRTERRVYYNYVISRWAGVSREMFVLIY